MSDHPVERQEWSASFQFSKDLLEYLKFADYYANNYMTIQLIEMCHTINRRIGRRTDEKLKKDKDADGEKIDIRKSVDEKLILASKYLMRSQTELIPANAQRLKTKAHNEAKLALNELNDVVWRLDMIFKGKMDPSQSYRSGRSGIA